MLAATEAPARSDPVRETGPPVDGPVACMTVCYRVRMNVRTNLLLSEDLVKEVDHFAGPRGRSRYVTEALEARLKRDRLREAIDATAGAWKDHPLFPTDESVVEWVREGRRDTRDPWEMSDDG